MRTDGPDFIPSLEREALLDFGEWIMVAPYLLWVLNETAGPVTGSAFGDA